MSDMALEHAKEREHRRSLSDRFNTLAKWASRASGHHSTFALAVFVIIAWAVTGPLFQWSDTWQLVINTGTTIVTFLMVFLIQNTQNRDAEAMHLKLDELIRTHKAARNTLLDIEDLTEEELQTMKRTFCQLAEAARAQAKREPQPGD